MFTFIDKSNACEATGHVHTGLDLYLHNGIM